MAKSQKGYVAQVVLFRSVFSTMSTFEPVKPFFANIVRFVSTM